MSSLLLSSENQIKIVSYSFDHSTADGIPSLLLGSQFGKMQELWLNPSDSSPGFYSIKPYMNSGLHHTDTVQYIHALNFNKVHLPAETLPIVSVS